MGPGRHKVNSRHHQAIDQLGSGLIVSALSVCDGIIEAVELMNKRLVWAVQWHPENLVESKDEESKTDAQALFLAFAKAL